MAYDLFLNSMDNDNEVAKIRPALSSSTYLNSFKSFMAHAKSTGFRTAQLRYNTLPSERTDPATEFLLNSALRRGDREFELSVHSYFEDPALVMLAQVGRRVDAGLEAVHLPSPLPLPMAVHEAIARRRSVRELSGEPLHLDQLATLLQCAGGVTAYATTELTDGSTCRLPLRAAPSGGGLYPVDIQIAALSLKGLNKGLYRFSPADSSLLPLGNTGRAEVDSLISALPGDFVDVRRASAFLVLSVAPWRSMRKYGARGMRFALMEAGYISENVHLACTALGIASCDYGGFYDNEINMLFGFDGTNEACVHVIVLGG